MLKRLLGSARRVSTWGAGLAAAALRLAAIQPSAATGWPTGAASWCWVDCRADARIERLASAPSLFDTSFAVATPLSSRHDTTIMVLRIVPIPFRWLISPCPGIRALRNHVHRKG